MVYRHYKQKSIWEDVKRADLRNLRKYNIYEYELICSSKEEYLGKYSIYEYWIWADLQNLSVNASIFTLTAIAVDRYKVSSHENHSYKVLLSCKSQLQSKFKVQST